MSVALYRKYRPATFAEVIGQEHVTEPLQQALRSDRVHHAYLFSGPRGCGKTSSARILARSLNCEQGPTPEPCGKCQSCLDLAPSGPGSIDVIEIDAASHGGVDDARDLRERSFFAPVASRFKIYIIDEAHMVTTAGFNALLKLVEEPPPHLKFIFATTEPEKVIGTIRSRTHHYPFRLVSPSVLREHLAGIAAAEGVSIEPAALGLVVRAGGGSVRDALSVLDQLIAGAGDGGVTYAAAVGLLGYTDAALLDEVVDALAARDGGAVFEIVDRLVNAGHDPRRFAEDLLDRLRDLVILDAVPEAGEKGLLDVSADELDRMRTQAAGLGAAELSRAADLVHAGLVEMRGTTSPRLLLELICARLLLPAASGDDAGLATRIERLERRISIGGVGGGGGGGRAPEPAAARPTPVRAPASAPTAVAAAKAPAAKAPATSAPAPNPVSAPAAAAGSLDAAAVRRVWEDVLDAVRRTRRPTHALLMSAGAQVVDLRGNTLVLAISTGPLQRLVSAGTNEEVLRGALREVLGVDWRIETTIAGVAAPEPPSAAEPAEPESAPVAPAPSDSDADAGEAQPDDADVDDADGLDLLRSHLGATVIDETDDE